jgi:RNA polymerase sigma-70 factor (ECF subfamily)
MSEQVTGDDIVNEFRKGNAQSLNLIFDLFYMPLCFFAEKLIVNKEEAEEIVGDTFMKLWERRPDFESLSKIKAFLYITTKHSCLNYIKQSDRFTQKYSEFVYLHAENEDHILNCIIKTEVLHQLYLAIQGLPSQCSKIAYMSFVEGMRNQEIADKLQLSINTVKNQKGRAIELLKVKLLESNIFILLWVCSHLSNKN